jgi:hypothetical protein
MGHEPCLQLVHASDPAFVPGAPFPRLIRRSPSAVPAPWSSSQPPGGHRTRCAGSLHWPPLGQFKIGDSWLTCMHACAALGCTEGCHSPPRTSFLRLSAVGLFSTNLSNECGRYCTRGQPKCSKTPRAVFTRLTAWRHGASSKRSTASPCRRTAWRRSTREGKLRWIRGAEINLDGESAEVGF